ncbi:hypothetical protein LZ554_003609 [Drepanopeziza brunnea f. sp. 'monogermtubi']|nr:hypothetical protein LZ554_003609 [Drepanopeziza brunnea f. sp. 'monogermtubi']
MKPSLLFAAAPVIAQQGAYLQCGGAGWTGLTTCVTGYACVVQNPFYSQCVPGTASVSSTSTKVSTSVRPTFTKSTVKSSTAVGATSKSSTSSSAVATSTSISGYAKASGGVFTINGKKTYFMGTNTYYIGFLTNSADVDLIMSHLASTGLKVLRVWGFNDVTTVPTGDTVWYQSFVSGQTPVINTGPNGLQRLDYVVQSAQAHGISLIINFVNNWSDYGGIAAYASYYGITNTAWYTNAAAQAQYQKYIAAVVARYKTSTAVFAWELANEPRCNSCPTSILTNWIASTSAYIKSLDANHMVCIGDEGFGLDGGTDTSYPYSAGEGLNFTTNLAIPTIDFGTYHAYPGSWGESDDWVPSWILSHATAAAAVGKPVVFEEYGTNSAKSVMLPWQAAVLGSSWTAGDMYWQYGDTLSIGPTHDDGHAIYYGSADYATLVTAHAAALNAKAV